MGRKTRQFCPRFRDHDNVCDNMGSGGGVRNDPIVFFSLPMQVTIHGNCQFTHDPGIGFLRKRNFMEDRQHPSYTGWGEVWGVSDCSTGRDQAVRAYVLVEENFQAGRGGKQSIRSLGDLVQPPRFGIRSRGGGMCV